MVIVNCIPFMATRSNSQSSGSLLGDVYRSVNNQYWYFTLAPISTSTFGAAVASASGGWDWQIWGLMVLFWYVIHSGMNALDLSAEDVNLDVDATVQRTVGVGLVGLGGAIGVGLSLLTTRLFLVLLVVMVFLGFSYTREWFDGRLHHREYATGVATLATTMGLIPVATGSLLMAQRLTPGVVVAGVGLSLHMAAMHILEDDTRSLKYERLGIAHDRDPDESFERLRSRVLLEHRLHLYGYLCTATGLVVEFAL